MEKQAKSYRTTTSFSAISSLPFNRIRVVDPKTDEDWTEKLVEMSRIEAEKSRLEEEKSRLSSPQALRQRVFLDPSSREPRQMVLLSGQAKERRAEKMRKTKLAAAELRKAKKLIWRADYKRITVDDASKEDSDSASDQELGGMEVDINNNSNQSKKRMTGRELLATGAVTSHIPEVERFPTEGNILILLIPRETSLQTIEEALSAMLEKVDLNGPTKVQRVCLTCYATKSPDCRFCDLQSRRPVSETTPSASLTAKPPSIRVSDPDTNEDLTEQFAMMRERREREAEESKIEQHMNASDYELMNAPAAREMSTDFLELRSQRARQDELLRQEKRERQLRRVKKNGIKKKSRTYVLLMSSMYGKWMHNISGEWTISA